jgi:hypothetical protein
MRSVGIRGSVVAAVASIFVLGYGVTTSVHAQQAAAANPELAAMGVWDAGTTYAKDDIVTARGSAWISLRSGNTNRVPGETRRPTDRWWGLFARGFNPSGAWSNATEYQPDDLVTYNGQTYRAKLTHTNRQPANTRFWELLVTRGAAGVAGAIGPQGPQGPAGPNTGISGGTQAAPGISFTGDADTGIYSPQADKIALVEGGTLLLHNFGSDNVALGLGALATNTAPLNTAVGAGALALNTTGAFNTAVGAAALTSNIDGVGNTAIGYAALANSMAGIGNTAIGQAALNNSSGSQNTAVGRFALIANTTGTFNAALGASALAANTTGGSNVAVGPFALLANTTGNANTALGISALAGNTMGINNTALGISALSRNTTGGDNSALGASALAFNTTGTYNTAVGKDALLNTTTGADNIAVGVSAAFNTNGSRNTVVGGAALAFNTTGSDNIAVGHNAGLNPASPSDSIFIGNAGAASDTTTIKIGTNDTQTRTFIAGIEGRPTGVADAVAVLIDSNGQLGTVNSSRRYKDDIEPMADVSALLARLRPVTFRYKAPYADGGKPIQYGLIAEEVAEILPDLAVFNAAGEPETVKYHLLPSFLLAGYQAQQNTIAAQADEIARLKERVAANEALEERLRRLEALLPQSRAAALQ